MDYNLNDVETHKLNVGEKYPLPTTAFLEYLDEDGDPELFKHKYYDASRHAEFETVNEAIAYFKKYLKKYRSITID